MVKISASLLAADATCLQNEVRRAEQAGVDMFHIDVMDCHYVPNLALSPHHVASLAPFTSLPFELHLEVDNPDYLLESFPTMQAESVIVHADTCPQPRDTFRRIQSQHARVGLALNKQYELRDIASFLSEIDLLVIMAVDPGFGGQKLDPLTLGRVKEARQMVNSLGLKVTVAVDGGISEGNSRAIIQAGAQELIIGSTLFKAADMGAIVRELRGCGPMPEHPRERTT
jgi:ribulose-phosphate 3-epimerase